MQSAATIKGSKAEVSTIRFSCKAFLEHTNSRAYVVALYTPQDCAVALDYAEWIAGEEANLYSLASARVPTFTDEESAQ